MKSLSYQVTFVTPAFLGNADQQAQWRTPPFKALLRQWWRVAYAAGKKFKVSVDDMRTEEGQLFGAANDEGGGSQQSRVRIRLMSEWRQPQIGKLRNVGKVCHPEVDRQGLPDCPHGGGKMVDAGLYLGYGPFQKLNAAIQANEPVDQPVELRVAWPDDETAVDDAIQLMHWFGTLGSRSRNGWGSVSLQHESLNSVIAAQAGIQNGLLRRVSCPLEECLELDWPHAFGRSSDDRLLIWKSKQSFQNWLEAMEALAKDKIGFRTQRLQFAHGETQHQTKPADIPFEDRHLLAYPVTHHAVAAWSEEFAPGRLKYDRQGWVVQSARLANQLRFKVARNAQGRLVALIYHLPCALPRELANRLGQQAPSIQTQAAIWSRVHDHLDNLANGFARI